MATPVKGLLLMSMLLFSSFVTITAQTGVEFTIREDTSNAFFEVYMRSNVSWQFPDNITGTGQVTIKVATSSDFEITNLMTNSGFPGSGFWGSNARVNSPVEAPGFDYISFGYIGSFQYPFEPGSEILLFSFSKPDTCLTSVELVDNYTDPFMPPNSQSANIGNSLVTLGSSGIDNGTGLANAWFGNYGGPVECDELPVAIVPHSAFIGGEGTIRLNSNLPDNFLDVFLTFHEYSQINCFVFDYMGRLRLSETRQIIPGSNLIDIDVSSLPNGVYFLMPVIRGSQLKALEFIKLN